MRYAIVDDGRALKSRRRVVQVATWDDYGEGAMTEPTRQRHCLDLEVLRQFPIARTAGRADAFDASTLLLLLYQSRLVDRRSGSAKAQAVDEASA